MEVGNECSVVWSVRRSTWCAQGACFLGCTCLRRQLTVRLTIMDSLLIVLVRVLVSGLALRGTVSGSHLVTSDAATRRQVISLLMRTLTCGIPLVTEMLLKAWFHRRIQASHLEGVEASDGC